MNADQFIFWLEGYLAGVQPTTDDVCLEMCQDIQAKIDALRNEKKPSFTAPQFPTGMRGGMVDCVARTAELRPSDLRAFAAPVEKTFIAAEFAAQRRPYATGGLIPRDIGNNPSYGPETNQ